MSSLVVLPCHAIAPLQDSKTESGGASLIQRYVQLAQLSRTPGISLVVSMDHFRRLVSAQAFPFEPSLAEVLRLSGQADRFTPKDLVSIVSGFLQRAQFSSQAFGISDVLFKVLKHEPNDWPVGVNLGGEDDHDWLVASGLAALALNQQRTAQLVVACRQQDPGVAMGVALEILVEALDGDHEAMSVTPLDGVALAGNVISAVLPIELAHHLNVEDLWRLVKTSDEAAAVLSIECHRQRRLRRYADERSLLPVYVQESFLKSCIPYGFRRDSMKIKHLLDAIADTLFGERLSQTHWIRVNAGAEAPQVRRGSFAAWRRDIDYEYHLHYWQSATSVRLASLVSHNDYGITF